MKKAELKRDGESLCSLSVADSYFLRLRGLIGRDVGTFGGLLIKPCNDIHTFFMSSGIDVIYTDKDYNVLKVTEALAPGKICSPVKGARRVIELPENSARNLGIREGQKLEVVYK
ncbi:MAG: DUF192 domain-containing protein [Oscillospiraceae bacterium]|nr:DUF192 domain-containing protein [Oscillospiraceae bacterium]